MKKIIVSIYAIAASLFLFSSCNKEQTTPSEQTSEPQTYTLTISATKAPSTKSFSLAGTTLNTVWDANDEVVVLVGNSDTELGRLHPLTTGTSDAVLSGTITGTVNVNDWIDLWYGGGLNNQDGTLETLSSHNSDRAKAWFQVESITDGTINPKVSDAGTFDTNGNVAFINWQAVVKFTVKNGENPLPVSKMIIKAANGNLEGGDGKELTITPDPSLSELYVAIDNLSETTDDYEIRVQASDGWYSLPATNKNFERGHYYNVTLKVTKEGQLIRTAVGPDSVFESDWSPSDTNNDLTYDSNTGNYSHAFTVPGNLSSVEYKVVAGHEWGTEWPSSGNYTVSDISDNGYSKTLTITYNPRNNTVSHSLVQNESPYKLYVKDEELATAAKWGSVRQPWSVYDFIQEADVDGYKCFAIPDAIVDGNAHDLYYKGDSYCEVMTSFTPSTGTTEYRYKTNGFEIVPAASSYTSEKRVWVQSNRDDVYAHMWQSSNSSNSTNWNTCKMSTNYSKYDGKYWYYATIDTGWDKLILSWADRNEYKDGNNQQIDGPQRVHYNISNSRNYYYYVTYYSDSAYWYGGLFTGGSWE